jgi:3-deoxy-D-manno-octulosonic-acid transferase
MNNLYNFGIRAYGLGIAIAGLVNSKARLWHKGRVALFERLATKIDTRGERVWVHVASLGEFEQARPIIEELKRVRPEVKVVVTFFSPSGYEIRKNYPKADCVEYLPEDTPESVLRFLDIVKPTVALFIKYEFWLNYLEELRKREIPTLLVSAIFRRDSIFFRPYGKAWRKALGTYETMFVQNDKSKELLNDLGYRDVVVAGDSRFDRVREIAQQAKEIEAIERFKGHSRLFVAGSTWERDEELIIDAMAKNHDIKFLIAPHEIGDDRVQGLMDR